ncbi:WD40 repeat-like protein [Gigaspora margarita]|uniref:WD40 repeat-like protein n=1 Tax=Gigaspora margarita TaxID=4874 RepID=A0A8H4AGE8_GIGMA|nr:WD40 repeat-like protein [Gigaspora margarita]
MESEEEFDDMDLCFTSSSVATNLFDEILNSNGQLQTDESNSLTNSENESDLTDSEEGLYPLAKGQSFSDWNDVENWKSDNQCVSLDNKYIWTATSDSSIKRWLDVPPRHIRKAISQTSSPSMSPISPQLSPMPPLTIPLSSMINLTSTGVSYGATLDAEVATLYSVTDDQKLEGQHGLIKCTILNNRRHIITLDNSGEVALWDIILCIRFKTFGKRDFNEVVQEVNAIEYNQLEALTVHLDERTCFDAEAYTDELDLQESAEIREDQRNDDRSLPLQHISFPPATVQAEQLSVNNTPTTLPTVSTAQNVNPPLPTTSAPPQSPTTLLAAFTTGPLTAPAATGSQPDYFSGSYHNSPTSPTGPSGNLTPPASTGSEPLKPPPPALINQTSSSSGSSNSIFGRLKLTSVRSKISKTPNTETKPESSGTSVSTKNNADTKTDSKPSAPTQSQDESSAQVRKDEKSKINSPTKSKVQVQNILPPFVQLPINESPEIQIPPHTTVIISEVSPEASPFVDSYRGAVETMVKDVELIEHRAHPWLLEFLLKACVNKIALKESVKIGFILKPHEGSELEELPNGNSRLTAYRMLRARKIL